jgi:DNA-binding NtrC family response regulator
MHLNWRTTLSNHAPVTVLSVSPFVEDHEALAHILRPYSWRLHRASTLAAATGFLPNQPVSVVVGERDLPPHTWRDLLEEVGALLSKPLVIVTSQQADDYLWAEALNLGAYGVLAKPFDVREVRRTLNIAALNWSWKHASRCQVSSGLLKAAKRAARLRQSIQNREHDSAGRSEATSG